MTNVYLIGICGTAMATVAAMLQQQGLHVRGSDAHAYPPMDGFLAAQGIRPLLGYDARHVTDDIDLVVIGNAVSRGNPEVEAVLARRMRYVSLPEMLRDRFLQGRRPIVVAGTHGKTTTTSMSAWALVEAGADPGFLVGGIPCNFDTSFRLGRSDLFVIEGDEYDSAFFDKTAKFPQVPSVRDRSRQRGVRPCRHLCRPGCAAPDVPPAGGARPGQWPGAAGGGRRGGPPAGQRRALPGRDLRRGGRGGLAGGGREFPGRPHALRGRATAGRTRRPRRPAAHRHVQRAERAGHDRCRRRRRKSRRRRRRPACPTFRGVRRRLERRGAARGVAVYDDFAHHPTAVRETLAAGGGVAETAPAGRIWAVFEPRSRHRVPPRVPGGVRRGRWRSRTWWSWGGGGGGGGGGGPRLLIGPSGGGAALGARDSPRTSPQRALRHATSTLSTRSSTSWAARRATGTWSSSCRTATSAASTNGCSTGSPAGPERRSAVRRCRGACPGWAMQRSCSPSTSGSTRSSTGASSRPRPRSGRLPAPACATWSAASRP